jgi:hypothetical protein
VQLKLQVTQNNLLLGSFVFLVKRFAALGIRATRRFLLAITSVEILDRRFAVWFLDSLALIAMTELAAENRRVSKT